MHEHDKKMFPTQRIMSYVFTALHKTIVPKLAGDSKG